MIEIVQATVAHATYVAAYMRERDRLELEAVTNLDLSELAGLAVLASRGYAFSVLLNGNPEFVFGVVVQPDHPTLGVAWGFGTDKARRCIPAASRFIRTFLIDELISLGVRRVEARASIENPDSNIWLTGPMGARLETYLPQYGRQGETFAQYAWTIEHVSFQNSEDATASHHTDAATEDGR